MLVSCRARKAEQWQKRLGIGARELEKSNIEQMDMPFRLGCDGLKDKKMDGWWITGRTEEQTKGQTDEQSPDR
jgi:hypothetical protein